MEHNIYIVVGVLGGCVDNIAASANDVAAAALFKKFCADYQYDPEHGESCENDVKVVTIAITVDESTTPSAEPVEVYELDE